MNLLEKMKVSIDTMNMGERFLGSLQVTGLGIGIVFSGLAVLYFAIVLMEKTAGRPTKAKVALEQKPVTIVEEEESMDSAELVAIITAAIASSLNTSTHNIIVRNIVRSEDVTPAWAKMGRMEQINNML